MVTSIHQQTLSRNDATCKIDINNLSVCPLQVSLVPFFDKHDELSNRNKDITCNTTIKKRFKNNQRYAPSVFS